MAINGAGGRLGRAIIAAADETEGVRLTAGLVRPGSEDAGMDLGRLAGGAEIGLAASTDPGALAGANVVIDVSTPDGLMNLDSQLPEEAALVTGVTGLSPEQQARLEIMAKKRALVQADNFSLGVALLRAFTAQAAAALGPDWDIEIAETHHRHKMDAPSGTALMLGREAAQARGGSLDDLASHERAGERRQGAIGFSVSRAGGIVGEHAVSFTHAAERLTLSHDAFDRSIFARGALRAALWAAGRPPGHYDMMDVLNLKDR